MGPLVSFAIAAVGVALCLALAWRARRWRRRGDHPHCRRCDFDLYGLPAGRCSECGADLTGRRAIAIGARRPARILQVLALLLAIALAVIAMRANRGINWFAMRAMASPTSWLVRDVTHADRAGVASGTTVVGGRLIGVMRTSGPFPLGAPGTRSPYHLSIRAISATINVQPADVVYGQGVSIFVLRYAYQSVGLSVGVPLATQMGPARLRVVCERRLYRPGTRTDEELFSQVIDAVDGDAVPADPIWRETLDAEVMIGASNNRNKTIHNR